MPTSDEQLITELARAMVADILESCSLEEIRQLIEEMEADLRKPH